MMSDHDPIEDGEFEEDSSSSGRNNGRSNGRVYGNVDGTRDEASEEGVQPRMFGVDLIDEEMSIALIEDAHSLPGVYPVVVIAARDEAFRALLLATVESEQRGDPFTITDRKSSRGNFISYRVELHVDSGRAALKRKAALAALEGVVTVF